MNQANSRKNDKRKAGRLVTRSRYSPQSLPKGTLRLMRLVTCCWCILFAVNLSFGQATDSLDFKIGQMILIGMPTTEVDSSVLREVKAGKVGSLIFFEKNIPKNNSFAGLKKM